MTFIIENNHIQVSTSTGQVIFDTNTPMPHIVQTLENSVNHTFNDSGDQLLYDHSIAVPNGCYLGNGYYTYRYYRSFFNRVIASDQSTTYTLGSASTGVNPDFIIVSAAATRTYAGKQKDYGTFVSAIPANNSNIIANGSTVLESAFDPSGDPWLSRIMSVYLSGNAIKVDFKHSNRDYYEQSRQERNACGNWPSSQYIVRSDDTRSDWSVSFKIYIGKFTVV